MLMGKTKVLGCYVCGYENRREKRVQCENIWHLIGLQEIKMQFDINFGNGSYNWRRAQRMHVSHLIKNQYESRFTLKERCAYFCASCFTLKERHTYFCTSCFTVNKRCTYFCMSRINII
jgi:hypothetical protein